MRQRQGIRSSSVSSRVRIGSTTSRSWGWSRAWSCFRRIRIPKVNPYLDPQEGYQRTGNRSWT